MPKSVPAFQTFNGGSVRLGSAGSPPSRIPPAAPPAAPAPLPEEHSAHDDGLRLFAAPSEASHEADLRRLFMASPALRAEFAGLDGGDGFETWRSYLAATTSRRTSRIGGQPWKTSR